MIPVGDDNSDRHRVPLVNYLLLLLNIGVFVFFQRMGFDTGFTMGYAAVPGEILTGKDLVTSTQHFEDLVTGEIITLPGLAPSPSPIWITLFTSMFMHGGWMHLAGNLLYLLVFGDNLENTMGHFRYLAFYLVTGLIASFSQIFTTVILGQDLLIPTLGASGAISGVLGGYLRLFPTRRVTVLVIIFFVHVPAVLVLGLWIIMQVMNSLGTLGGMETGSIAYAAHIGGFIAGMFLVGRFVPRIAKRRVQSRRVR